MKKSLIISCLVLSLFLIVYTSISAIPQIEFSSNTDNVDVLGRYIFVNVTSSDYQDIFTFIDFNHDLRLWLGMDYVNQTGFNSIVYDNSSYGNNAIASSYAIQNESGRFGKCYSFSDGQSKLIVPYNDSLHFSGNDEITISAWVYPKSFSSAFTSSWVVSQGSEIMLRYYNTDAKVDFVLNSFSSNDRVSSSVGAIIENQWNHILGVYNGSQLMIYINGKINASVNPVGTYGGINDSFLIGRSASNEYGVNGSIDEVMIFNRALTMQEISSLYNSSANSYYRNFTQLNYLTTYNFTAYSVGADGTNNQTEERSVSTAKLESLSFSYPHNYTLFQRHNDTTGEIKIIGSYTGNPNYIEASFNGADFVNISTSPIGNSFTGYFNTSVGQGDLVIRFSNNYSINSTLSNISIGDLFVIGGQSNAEGRANTIFTLNSSNLYLATVYREDDFWVVANDPTDTGSSAGSVWVRVADYIIQNKSIPVSFITTAYGGSLISDWQKGQNLYDNMYQQISEATNGTMKVKSMFFYQGEGDSRTDMGERGNYETYKGNLSQTIDFFISDTEIAERVVVGQISRADGNNNRTTLDNIRKAQQDLWEESLNCAEGVITYDMELSPVDRLHFRTDAEVLELARRWWISIAREIYGLENLNSTYLKYITKYNSDTNTTINFTFSNNISVAYWNGTSAITPRGFRIKSGTNVYTDENITSISISGKEVSLTFDSLLTEDLNASYGSNNDAYNLPVLMDNNLLPIKLFLDFNYSSIIDEVETSSESTGGSGSTKNLNFNVEEDKLQEGYNKNVLETWSLKFEVRNEKHTLKVNSISDGKVKITISSEPITLELSVGEEKKVDFDSDGIYDLHIKVNSISGKVANIYLKEISEKYSSETSSENVNEKDTEVPQNVKEKNYSLIWILCLIVIAGVLIYFGLRTYKKRKNWRF